MACKSLALAIVIAVKESFFKKEGNHELQIFQISL